MVILGTKYSVMVMERIYGWWWPNIVIEMGWI